MDKFKYGGITIDTKALPQEVERLKAQKAKSESKWKAYFKKLNTPIDKLPKESEQDRDYYG